MKIHDVTTFILEAPPADVSLYSSQTRLGRRKALLVRVRTDDGVVGWGEGGMSGPAAPVASVINAVLGPQIIGADARHRVRLWEQLYASTRDFGQKGTYIEALSAIDIALWDICGQASDVPIHTLLGGAFRDRVDAYATGGFYTERYRDPDAAVREVAAEAEAYVQQGFRAVKIKLGLCPLAVDVARVAAVRHAVGPRVQVLIDANHAYDASTAIRLGRAIEEYDVAWFEEPVTPEDRAGYRRVRDALAIPIAGGEAEFSRFGFRDLIAGGCIDVAQPDLCGCGGFSEFVKIHALTGAFGLRLVPHIWGSAVAVAAAAHALAVLPPAPHTHEPVALQNLPIAEYDQSPNPLREELVDEPVRVEDGTLHIPQAPGLGVSVNDAVILRYAVDHG